MKTKLTLFLLFLTLGLRAQTNVPGTNLVFMPVGSYSNATAYFMAGGTNTGNPYGWELFKAVWNNFKYITNWMATVYSTGSNRTNAWSGPTNTIDLTPGLYDQSYASATPVEVTGFVNKPTTNTAEVLLSVKNTAASNIWVTLPVPVVEDGRTGVFTITNGTVGMLWLRYTPVGPRTNSVCRDM